MVGDGLALQFLLFLAHGVAASPMASVLLPTLPGGLFALMIAGLLWCLLWRTGWRWLGLAPLAVGAIGALFLTPPDVVVTGDGRHVAVRVKDGMAILRSGAGDYVRDTLSEGAGYDGALNPLADLPEARCSSDLCALKMERGGRTWQLLLTRSAMLVDRDRLESDCARADIVVADRGLPYWCRPRWLKIDRRLLARTGGVSIDLTRGAVHTVAKPGDAHPWIMRPQRANAGRRGTARRWSTPAPGDRQL